MSKRPRKPGPTEPQSPSENGSPLPPPPGDVEGNGGPAPAPSEPAVPTADGAHVTTNGSPPPPLPTPSPGESGSEPRCPLVTVEDLAKLSDEDLKAVVNCHHRQFLGSLRDAIRTHARMVGAA